MLDQTGWPTKVKSDDMEDFSDTIAKRIRAQARAITQAEAKSPNCAWLRQLWAQDGEPTDDAENGFKSDESGDEGAEKEADEEADEEAEEEAEEKAFDEEDADDDVGDECGIRGKVSGNGKLIEFFLCAHSPNTVPERLD